MSKGRKEEIKDNFGLQPGQLYQEEASLEHWEVNLSTFQNNSFFLTQAALSPSWKDFSQFFWNEILCVFHDLKCVLHGGSKMPTDETLHGALMLVRQPHDGTHLEVAEQLMCSCFILLFCFHHVAPWKTKSGCLLCQQATLLMNHIVWQRNPKSWKTAMNHPVSILFSLCIERMRSSHEWQCFQFHIFSLQGQVSLCSFWLTWNSSCKPG